MHIKSILIVLIISAVYLHESEAVPKPFGHIKAKLALIKAKIAVKKAPLVIAKAIVGKEVKTKVKIAAVKAVAAAKAAKVAAVSVLKAPFKVAKTKFAIKLAALKALKLAKIAKTAAILKLLKQKKKPIIIPVPLPPKPLPPLPPLPPLLPLPPLPSISLQPRAPVYRFVPEFTNINRVAITQPRLEVEVPAPVVAPVVETIQPPAQIYGPPPVVHKVYGVPN